MAWGGLKLGGGGLALLDAQRGALFPWLPVWLGAGIALYFWLPVEPSVPQLWLAALAGFALLLPAWAWRLGAGPLLMIPALMLGGLALAGARARIVEAPVLDHRFYGAVEGRVIEVDRSASGLVRLTLDDLVMGRLPPDKTPKRVRISVQGAQPWLKPEPGQRLITSALLGPPEGPALPGGFDFRRTAWFRGLGGIGYTQTPVLLLQPPEPGVLGLARLRHQLAAGIRRDLHGQSGAFAAAILTGDYDGLSEETYDSLRASNLIHLISISGLHMVLLCGAVFWGLRLALVLIPGAAIYLPVRKIAALGALAMGAGYYLLSGGAIPAERAWVMIAVVFVAVLVDRRAISMRGLALAALVVLLLRPESLIDAGFQMSFAATLALVAGMEPALRRLATWPSWARTVVGAIIASSLAGFASAPFAAAHFNRYSEYGLLANLLAAPLMGLVVMPLCVVWMLALPFGAAEPVLWLMGLGINGVLAVGASVASLPGATRGVASPSLVVLPFLTGGALLLALLQGRFRFVGVVPILAALFLWSETRRPDVLISASGGLIGVMTDAGRALSKPTGDRFIAERWLEDDGDFATQAEAATRDGIRRSKNNNILEFAGLRIHHLTGRAAEQPLAKICDKADLIILTAKPEVVPCPTWSPKDFARTGAIALWQENGSALVLTASSASGQRLWSPGKPAMLDITPARRRWEQSQPPPVASGAPAKPAAAKNRTAKSQMSPS